MTAAPSLLLSAAESSRAARPLRGWSESDQALLAGAVQALLDQWNAAWGLPAAEGEAVEIGSCPIDGDSWSTASWTRQDAQGSPRGVFWSLRGGTIGTNLVAVPLRRYPLELDALHLALFREAPVPTGPGKLADQLVRAAWADWNRRLAGLLPGGSEAMLPEKDASSLLNRPWSGAVLIVLPWCGRQMALLFTADQVSAFLDTRRDRAAAARPGTARTPLVPLLQVVEGESVALRVELVEMEIDLGTLAGLRPGDVLRTAHRLDAPLELIGQGQTEPATRCTGHLGRQDDWRAIELLPYATPARNGAAT